MTYSEYYLERVRLQMLSFKDPCTVTFLNNLFNYLNDVTSELFMILKEETMTNIMADRNFVQRRTRYYIDIIIDLSRVLEVISGWAPEVFLSVD